MPQPNPQPVPIQQDPDALLLKQQLNTPGPLGALIRRLVKEGALHLPPDTP